MIFIFAMVLATQLARLSPLALSNLRISEKFEDWLSHVPIAILTALVVPEFFTNGEANGAPVWNPLFCTAAVFCLAVGVISKNLLMTTFAGIAFVAIARLVLTI